VGVDVYILLIFTIVLGELEADAAPVEVGSFLILTAEESPTRELLPRKLSKSTPPSCGRQSTPPCWLADFKNQVNPLPLAG